MVAPLQGRDCTAPGNWRDGRGVRILAYPVPADPTAADRWKPEVLCDSLYTVHNFDVVPDTPGPKMQTRDLSLASADGVGFLGTIDNRTWQYLRASPGDQRVPTGARGASEVARHVSGLTASIEPWHGGQVVVYPPAGFNTGPRTVLDDKLRWGHAIKLADLDGDGTPEVIAGVRDDPAKGDTFPDRRGVRVYRSTDGWKTFTRHPIDPGGVAVEDLAVADLDGDGRPDLVAVGRQTKNVKIYWNRKP